jgi:hypothetical protein
MPFYEGLTLRAALRDLPRTPGESWLTALLAQLLDALELIHARNCFHRDIAPDNILLLRDGRPLLLDFGAARRVIGDMTQVLTVILKPGYAPLEQYAETPSMKQGPWTDLYALASVVYFAITGEAPAPAVARVLTDPVVPIRKAAAGRYSEALLGAIDRALSVRPEGRPQSVAEFRRALGIHESKERTPGSAQVGSSSHSRAERSASVRHRLRDKRALVVASALMVVGAAAGWSYWTYDSHTPDIPSTKEMQRKVEPPVKETLVPPERLATQIEERLRSFECARVAWSDAGAGVLRLTGHVSTAAERERLAGELGSVAGVRSVSASDVQVLPRPYCEIASMLAAHSGAGTLRIGLKGGGTAAHEGDRLVVEVESGDFAGYLYADLYGADGKVAHLLPNSQNRNNRADARKSLTVG